jgi:disulfide bond formation protein DsbB|tara:strand:- start:468 stop:947 length:480 start_codon:yes stop_codon:yes gene_type:complete
MLKKIIKNHFYTSILLISFLIILSALFIEHVLSVPACKLCLYQRIPYIFSIIICFLGYFFSKNKAFLYLLISVFISSVILSGYHIGIENNIFLEFSGCTNDSFDTIDKNELLLSLNNSIPNCKDVNFKVFGLSLATINFILSIALILITIRHLYNENYR